MQTVKLKEHSRERVRKQMERSARKVYLRLEDALPHRYFPERISYLREERQLRMWINVRERALARWFSLR